MGCSTRTARPDLGPAHRLRRARQGRRSSWLARARPHLPHYPKIELESRSGWCPKRGILWCWCCLGRVAPSTLVVASPCKTSPSSRPRAATAWPGSLRRLTIRLRQPVQHLLPGSSGLHQRPTDGQKHPEWHLHMPFYLRRHSASATVRVHGGYEMLPSDPQRRHHLSSSASACVGCRRCIG
jgi:hypothetical protein